MFTVEATDGAGNTASASAHYRVLSTTPGTVIAWGIAAGANQSLAIGRLPEVMPFPSFAQT